MSGKSLSRKLSPPPVPSAARIPASNVIRFVGSQGTYEELGRGSEDSATADGIHRGILLLTPKQRLTLWTLVEHPRLLDAMETIVDELSGGLQ